ncbi:Uncharacterised protein [Klebsiella pneumoniae]|nr:Uncharacterised protein [Klebsiella pneumoniae]
MNLFDKAVMQKVETFPAHSGQPEPAFVVSNNHVLIHPQRQLLANVRPYFSMAPASIWLASAKRSGPG